MFFLNSLNIIIIQMGLEDNDREKDLLNGVGGISAVVRLVTQFRIIWGSKQSQFVLIEEKNKDNWHFVFA